MVSGSRSTMMARLDISVEICLNKIEYGFRKNKNHAWIPNAWFLFFQIAKRIVNIRLINEIRCMYFHQSAQFLWFLPVHEQ